MKLCSPLVIVAVAAALAAVTSAQAVKYAQFPYCKCPLSNQTSPYSLSTPVAKGGGQYCFTLKVDPAVVADCNAYCCKADLYKIELDVNSECKVAGAVFNATINGVPTKYRPTIDLAKDGPDGAAIMRLTQLGLNLTSNGAEICITLASRKPGVGCTTLEQLCVPPKNSAPGNCAAALFDSKMDCCPVPAPPPTPNPGCEVCATLSLGSSQADFQVAISEAQCKEWGTIVAEDFTAKVDELGGLMAGGGPLFTCNATSAKVCGTVKQLDDFKPLQEWVNTEVKSWLEVVTGDNEAMCPPYLRKFNVSVDVTSGSDKVASCLSASTYRNCNISFPVCTCNTTPAATPFGAASTTVRLPGRKPSTSLYCFTVEVVEPADPKSVCGKSSTLLKAEIWANDDLRRKVYGIGVQPAGASVMKFLSPTWGRIGEDTLKATPLRWTKEQAKGAQICMEVHNSIDIKDLCNTGTDTCWINFFDSSLKCCPLYYSTLV